MGRDKKRREWEEKKILPPPLVSFGFSFSSLLFCACYAEYTFFVVAARLLVEVNVRRRISFFFLNLDAFPDNSTLKKMPTSEKVSGLESLR